MNVMCLLPLCFGMLFGGRSESASAQENYAVNRHQMVERQIIRRGVSDPRVIAAMEKVPRHLFIPESTRYEAYEDRPVSIGEGQTISQPYIVAFMTEALELGPDDRVLEIGTGSGYQAAVLAEIVSEVYTVEIVELLGMRSRRLLEDELGYDNISFRIGDGYQGWIEHAPYDAIIVTAAPPEIPQALIDQLAEGGRIIVPVGSQWTAQRLISGVKRDGELVTEEVMAVRFVPMVTE